jgi:hypothetical protein
MARHSVDSLREHSERGRDLPRWKLRKEALLETLEEKRRPNPIPSRHDDLPDADDSSLRRNLLL